MGHPESFSLTTVEARDIEKVVICGKADNFIRGEDTMYSFACFAVQGVQAPCSDVEKVEHPGGVIYL
jgi:hypothetical protein